MKIKEVIQNIKDYHGGIGFDGKVIDEKTTRDKVLYGNVEKECTGIVTCIWASAKVIQIAKELKANLIISHEAIFWNHGDHTDWLIDNEIFNKKKQLLDESDITVWRDHDYIHSGIPVDDKLYDGIFYGLMIKLDWLKYAYISEKGVQRFGQLKFPGIRAIDLAKEIKDKLQLDGIRLVGDPNTIVKNACISPHVLGEADNEIIKYVDKLDVDCLFTMELIDYTVSEYIRDSAKLNHPRCIISVGHFNLEQPGMEYATKWLAKAIGEESIPVHFVSDGDVFSYL